MRQTCSMLAMLAVLVSAGTTGAQTIDAGRGDLPLRVPSGYDAATPTPLIVLLHGYTSSGAGQDTYMNVSALADTYGFIMVAPDGTQETGGNQSRFWNASSACCNFFESKVDDVAYLAGLIDAIPRPDSGPCAPAPPRRPRADGPSPRPPSPGSWT